MCVCRSSSSSDSEGGGAGVIGLGGGSESEGEGVGDSPPTSGGELKSPSTSQEQQEGEPPSFACSISLLYVVGGESGSQSTGIEMMESEDGAGQSKDRPSQTVEGLFGDAADLSSSWVTSDPGVM